MAILKLIEVTTRKVTTSKDVDKTTKSIKNIKSAFLQKKECNRR